MEAISTLTSTETSTLPSGYSGYNGLRQDAIDLGRIIDVSEIADKAGFRWPVAVTKAVYDATVRFVCGDDPDLYVDAERERLIDLMRSCARTVRDKRPETSTMSFSVVRTSNDTGLPVRVNMQIVAHLGDEGEPVLTITLIDV